MTYTERLNELTRKAIAEGRKHWEEGNNSWYCGAGYWAPDFTTEELAELTALLATLFNTEE